MKIFISWSGVGSKSHVLAQAFHDWLPNVFQNIETFMSSDSLVAGERWQGGLSNQLEQSDFGIACLTPKSYQAKWILFECGALAKKVDVGCVVPVRCDVTQQMLNNHPLTMFNSVSLDEQGMKRLVEAINGSLEHRLLKEKLEKTFKTWWPEFDHEHLTKVRATVDGDAPRKEFNLEASVEEMLSILRSLSRRSTLDLSGSSWVAPSNSARILLSQALQTTAEEDAKEFVLRLAKTWGGGESRTRRE